MSDNYGEGERRAPDGWRPEDQYKDLVRSNDSRYIRAHIRALWSKGQQLWDSHVNNNFTWFADWFPMWAHWRRNWRISSMAPVRQTPPWYTPIMQKYVVDPVHINPLNTGSGMNYEPIEGTVRMVLPMFVRPYDWFPGARAYVLADRYVVVWTGDRCVPMFRLQQPDKNFEISAFANRPPPEGVMFTHRVSQPFRIYTGNTDGRVRGWPYGRPPLVLTKNGTAVGYCYMTQQGASGVSVGVDVDFEEGDILKVMMPPGYLRRGRNISVSIVGGIIE